MTAPKFTPGPWRVVHSTGDVDAHDRNIARTQQGGFYKVDDAHLIAAAPELYQALCNLRIRYESLFDIYQRPTYAEGCDPQSDLELALTEANAAIAKARGES